MPIPLIPKESIPPASIEGTVMKRLFQVLITVAFMLALLSVVGKIPPGLFANEIIVKSGFLKKYDPEEGRDRLVPGNYRKMYDPEKQCYVLMPDYYIRAYDPERSHERLVPKGYVKR